MSTLRLEPEDIISEIYYFQLPSGTKMLCIYEELLKEGDVDHKYLRFPDLRYKGFDILRSYITLDKVDLVCA